MDRGYYGCGFFEGDRVAYEGVEYTAGEFTTIWNPRPDGWLKDGWKSPHCFELIADDGTVKFHFVSSSHLTLVREAT